MNHSSVLALVLACLTSFMVAGTVLAQAQQAPSENCHKYYFGPGDESARVYYEMSRDERRKCDHWVYQYERGQDTEEQIEQLTPLTEEIKQEAIQELRRKFRKMGDNIETCINSSRYLEHAMTCMIMELGQIMESE